MPPGRGEGPPSLRGRGDVARNHTSGSRACDSDKVARGCEEDEEEKEEGAEEAEEKAAGQAKAEEAEGADDMERDERLLPSHTERKSRRRGRAEAAAVGMLVERGRRMAFADHDAVQVEVAAVVWPGERGRRRGGGD